MLDYAMESGQEMAVAPLKGNWNSVRITDPPVEEVFGWGKVVRLDPLPDGRSNIILEGKGIARLRHYETMEPFRIAEVEKIHSDQNHRETSEFQSIFERLLFMTKRILFTEGAGEDVILRLNDLNQHPYPVEFMTSILTLPFRIKQQILEQEDPISKALLLLEILETRNLRE